MTSKSGSSVHIGSVGGSIQNANIAGRDILSSPVSVESIDEARALLREIQSALTDLAPRIAAELGANSPAVAHLGKASVETLETAVKQINAQMDKRTAKQVHSNLEQVRSMLDLLLKGAVSVPEAVTKAGDSVGGLVARLTDLATKLGQATLWISRFFM
jgi:hypothetical protein